MQQKVSTRIVVYAKDVMILTGRKPRAAWKLLASIKKKYKKQRGQFVTVREFAEFTGIAMEDIQSSLVD
jgi:hypothetical protein